MNIVNNLLHGAGGASSSADDGDGAGDRDDAASVASSYDGEEEFDADED